MVASIYNSDPQDIEILVIHTMSLKNRNCRVVMVAVVVKAPCNTTRERSSRAVFVFLNLPRRDTQRNACSSQNRKMEKAVSFENSGRKYLKKRASYENRWSDENDVKMRMCEWGFVPTNHRMVLADALLLACVCVIFFCVFGHSDIQGSD